MIFCSIFKGFSLSKFPCEGCFVKSFFSDGCFVILPKVSLIIIIFFELHFLKVWVVSLFLSKSAFLVVLGSYGKFEELELWVLEVWEEFDEESSFSNNWIE